MSRIKGDSQLSVNIEPLSQGPLDARLVVSTQADLVDPESYPDKNYYQGMTVTVADDGSIWTLKDPDHIYTLDSWVKQSTGKGVQEIIIVDNVTTENPAEALSSRQGKILNDKIKDINQNLDKFKGDMTWWEEPTDD